ncbi:LacI family DNA-binding transcriptional regulator [Falsirhodobacter sp. 20TX0035]|uniref:LacI family DNA-binding transcriptional regulator n=1 Tax=Falsirhodobacter sp. 20TX0035 TaxID=3022019 RepID=UPI00232FCD13|nr:LacI family DNA-binding transcriptional regulator [Falsirhodobacter sp. 20TX0035]MDB6454548.1 LacI family DNA-binding transcriptional regulator [Falsirhodobacter sp. 20TX0035]
MPAAEPEPSGEPVTMATIARLAGVTQPTVSRAFNHPEKLSPDTLHKIMEAVRLTGYVPNMVAGGLASNRSRMLAAIVPSITNIIYSALVQTFTALVRERGYQVMLMESGFDLAEEERLVRIALARRPEGLLLTGVDHSPTCRRMIQGANLPTVEVWDLGEAPIDTCVGFSHDGAARAAAEWLLARGYDDFSVVSADDPRAHRRRTAFRDAVTAAGLPPPAEILLPGSASLRRGRDALSQLVADGLLNPARRSAIFCSSDVLAQGILIEAQARGIVIPRDLGLMGFGDQDFAVDLHPALTTVRVDRGMLGQRAAEALIRRIDAVAAPERRIDIGYRIIERHSA